MTDNNPEPPVYKASPPPPGAPTWSGDPDPNPNPRPEPSRSDPPPDTRKGAVRPVCDPEANRSGGPQLPSRSQRLQSALGVGVAGNRPLRCGLQFISLPDQMGLMTYHPRQSGSSLTGSSSVSSGRRYLSGLAWS